MAEYRLPERERIMINFYAAIDPLAMLLPSDIYQHLVEKLHPHEPATAHLAETMKRMSPEQRVYVQTRIRIFTEYAGAVSKALGAEHK